LESFVEYPPTLLYLGGGCQTLGCTVHKIAAGSTASEALCFCVWRGSGLVGASGCITLALGRVYHVLLPVCQAGPVSHPVVSSKPAVCDPFTNHRNFASPGIDLAPESLPRQPDSDARRLTEKLPPVLQLFFCFSLRHTTCSCLFKVELLQYLSPVDTVVFVFPTAS
jgi:hypothetical protein